MVNAETKEDDQLQPPPRITKARRREWEEQRKQQRRVLYDEWAVLLEGQVIPPNKPRKTSHNLKLGHYPFENDTYLAYGQDGFLDFEGTVANLKKAEKVLIDAVNRMT